MSIVSNFEYTLLVLSFCKNKYRSTVDISEYMGISLRTAQRLVNELVEYGYLEYSGNVNNRLYATTPKAALSINRGVAP